MELVMQLIALLTPVFGGKLTEWVTEGIKHVAGWLSGTAAWVKQGVALLVSTLLAYGASFLNAPQIIDGDPGVIVNAILAWAIAMLFHNGDKLAQIKPTALKPSSE